MGYQETPWSKGLLIYKDREEDTLINERFLIFWISASEQITPCGMETVGLHGSGRRRQITLG
jgi:hypothetical protein